MGVDFASDAAEAAAHNAKCPAYALKDFRAHLANTKFDALHLGDVLEHLVDPVKTIDELLPLANPDGLLFIEGPLENNPSPVFWAALLFGSLKRLHNPSFVGVGAPTHLLRVNARQQKDFFQRFWPSLELLHWDVHETGWPYLAAGGVKRVIADTAIAIGGKTLCGRSFGNRFRAILRLPGAKRS